MKKRHMTTLSAILLATTALVGCVTTNVDTSVVEYGDSQQSVMMMLGEPGNRQLHGRYEVFQYCTVGAGIGVTRFDMVWFYNGHVTGVSDYELGDARVCDRHYRTVDWDAAPERPEKADRIIEIRDTRKNADVEVSISTTDSENELGE